jgi:hypothetical protein
MVLIAGSMTSEDHPEESDESIESDSDELSLKFSERDEGSESSLSTLTL